MSTTTMHIPRQQPNTSTGGVPERDQTIHLGTFADGQRAIPVTVTYSPSVGSWATSSEGNPGTQSPSPRGWLGT